MQRSICTPLIPALNSAARSYRYSHTAPLLANAKQTSQFQQSVGAMRSQLFKRNLPPQEFYTLKSVHNIMQLYRACRGETDPANVSDLILTILTTLQMRQNVLKPLISDVRDQIIKKQNEEVNGFLNEIVDDLIDSRSFASRTGLVYLLTAFDMTGCTSLSSSTWRRLRSSASEKLRSELNDPRVVSAALKYADPESMSLDELEKTYSETVALHGRSLQADEALISGFLRFREFDKVIVHYTEMIEFYDVAEDEQLFTRINNQILTVCNVYAYAKPLFYSALSENSSIQLHPTAAARFITLTYMSTEDIELTVDVYLKALNKLQTQPSKYAPFTTRVMVSEVLKTVIAVRFAYEGAVPQARAVLDKILASGLNSAHSLLILNQTLSLVAKKWPESDFILELLQKYPTTLQFDSLRVLLTSVAGLPASKVPTAQVEQWWRALCTEKEALTFEWLALIKACNEPTRVEFLKQEIKQHKPNLDTLYLDPRVFMHALPALTALGYDIPSAAPEEKKYTDSMLAEEFAVCSANANNASFFHPDEKPRRRRRRN